MVNWHKFVSGRWWLARPRKWFAYAVLITVSWLGFIFFRLINWTKVEGREKFRSARRRHQERGRQNVIIVSNHLTMYDSFMVGIIAFFPELIFWPSVAPFHLAASENFYKHWFFRLILYCLNALPVKPSRVDLEVMKKILGLLPNSNVHIFPGGRRSFEPLGNEAAHPIRAGIGYILANAPEPKPLVVPVHIGGIEKIFGGAPGQKGTARWFPRLGGILRRPLVKFGDPVKWQDIIESQGNNKEAWQAVAQRIAEAINQLAPSNSVP